ncbi:MAG: DUF4167 domain-containing protein [Rhodobacteraceae bacterium]|jgi:hypothetical protein|nr:DUF4167 domain-containing protein [Paracoccaceae bacterium]
MRSSKSRSRSKANRNRSLGNIINRVFDSSGPEGKVRGTPQQIIDKYTQLARDAQLSNDRVAAENFQQHAEHYTRMLAEAQREMDAMRVEQGGNWQGGQAGAQGGAQGDQRRDDPQQGQRPDQRPDQPQGQRYENRRDDRNDGRNDGRRDDRNDGRRNDRGDQRRDDARRDDRDAPRPADQTDDVVYAAPDVIDFADDDGPGLVETPESVAVAIPLVAAPLGSGVAVDPVPEAEPEKRRAPRRRRGPKPAAGDGADGPASDAPEAAE